MLGERRTFAILVGIVLLSGAVAFVVVKFGVRDERERQSESESEVIQALASENQFCGAVVGVYDGDTITVRDGNTTYKVRLAGIDAPELKQQYGVECRDALRWLVSDKDVCVRWSVKDRYGRYVGMVFGSEAGYLNVNLAMLGSGYAWHYSDYDRTETFISHQIEARKGRVGLWSQEDPEPPWDYRKKNRK